MSWCRCRAASSFLRCGNSITDSKRPRVIPDTANLPGSVSRIGFMAGLKTSGVLQDWGMAPLNLAFVLDHLANPDMASYGFPVRSGEALPTQSRFPIERVLTIYHIVISSPRDDPGRHSIPACLFDVSDC